MSVVQSVLQGVKQIAEGNYSELTTVQIRQVSLLCGADMLYAEPLTGSPVELNISANRGVDHHALITRIPLL